MKDNLNVTVSKFEITELDGGSYFVSAEKNKVRLFCFISAKVVCNSKK